MAERLPVRTWLPYWLAGATNAAVNERLWQHWPHSFALAAASALGVLAFVLIRIAHRVEQRLRRPTHAGPRSES